MTETYKLERTPINSINQISERKFENYDLDSDSRRAAESETEPAALFKLEPAKATDHPSLPVLLFFVVELFIATICFFHFMLWDSKSLDGNKCSTIDSIARLKLNFSIVNTWFGFTRLRSPVTTFDKMIRRVSLKEDDDNDEAERDYENFPIPFKIVSSRHA